MANSPILSETTPLYNTAWYQDWWTANSWQILGHGPNPKTGYYNATNTACQIATDQVRFVNLNANNGAFSADQVLQYEQNFVAQCISATPPTTQPQETPQQYLDWWNNGGNNINGDSWIPPGTDYYEYNNVPCELETDIYLQAITNYKNGSMSAQQFATTQQQWGSQCLTTTPTGSSSSTNKNPTPPPDPLVPDWAFYIVLPIMATAGISGCIGPSKLAVILGLGAGVPLAYLFIEAEDAVNSVDTGTHWYDYLIKSVTGGYQREAAEWAADKIWSWIFPDLSIKTIERVSLGIAAGVATGALYLGGAICVRPFAQPIAQQVFGDIAQPLAG